MNELFYTQTTLERQRRLRKRRERNLLIASAVFLLLTAAVCLLQNRQNQPLGTVLNGMLSSAYFSYLLYFLSYRHRKERAYEALVADILKKPAVFVSGTVLACTLACDGLEEVWQLRFAAAGGAEKQYLLSRRTGFDPQTVAGTRIVLRVYRNYVVGIGEQS